MQVLLNKNSNFLIKKSLNHQHTSEIIKKSEFGTLTTDKTVDSEHPVTSSARNILPSRLFKIDLTNQTKSLRCLNISKGIKQNSSTTNSGKASSENIFLNKGITNELNKIHTRGQLAQQQSAQRYKTGTNKDYNQIEVDQPRKSTEQLSMVYKVTSAPFQIDRNIFKQYNPKYLSMVNFPHNTNDSGIVKTGSNQIPREKARINDVNILDPSCNSQARSMAISETKKL